MEGSSGRGVRLHLRTGGEDRFLEATDIPVAAGRTPNSDALDAERAGIGLDSRGYVRVDDELRTTAEGVWGVGDCAGNPQFTRAGYDDYRVVMDDLAGAVARRATD